MKKNLYTLSAVAIALLAIGSCDETPVPSENKTDVKSVTINDQSVNVMVGETKQVDMTMNPKNANTAQLVWESSDESIATVSSGAITGVKNGTATIAVTIYGQESPAASVKVIVDKYSVTSVTLDHSSLTVICGKDVKITASVAPDNASFKTVTWESSDKAVATVKDDGTVSGVKAGSATITATADGKSATCAVTVIDADDFDIATDAEAGSKKIVGGDQEDIAVTEDNFLSYDSKTQTVSWTENTTGKNRTASLELSSGSKISVSQASVKASSFKGTWSFRTQRFSNNTTVTTAAADITFDVTIEGALFGETLTDYDGKMYTNTLGLKGLYLDAVADAVVVPDEDGVKFGLLLDERKAQKVANGNSTYPYVCFIPECGTVWNTSAMSSPWNFVPRPISEKQNYQWLWFLVKDDNKTLNYDSPNKQYLIGTDGTNGTTIIGITCAVAKNATPSADDIFGTYNVIYQANPGKNNNVGGFTLTKK